MSRRLSWRDGRPLILDWHSGSPAPVRQALFNASYSRKCCSCALHRQLIGARLEATIGAPKAGSASAPLSVVHKRQPSDNRPNAKAHLLTPTTRGRCCRSSTLTRVRARRSASAEVPLVQASACGPLPGAKRNGSFVEVYAVDWDGMEKGEG
jgi:hypothetical protein